MLGAVQGRFDRRFISSRVKLRLQLRGEAENCRGYVSRLHGLRHCIECPVQRGIRALQLRIHVIHTHAFLIAQDPQFQTIMGQRATQPQCTRPHSNRFPMIPDFVTTPQTIHIREEHSATSDVSELWGPSVGALTCWTLHRSRLRHHQRARLHDREECNWEGPASVAIAITEQDDVRCILSPSRILVVKDQCIVVYDICFELEAPRLRWLGRPVRLRRCWPGHQRGNRCMAPFWTST